MTDNEILLALSNMLEPIRNDLQDIKGRVKKIELAQENVILPRLQNIAKSSKESHNSKT